MKKLIVLLVVSGMGLVIITTTLAGEDSIPQRWRFMRGATPEELGDYRTQFNTPYVLCIGGTNHLGRTMVFLSKNRCWYETGALTNDLNIVFNLLMLQVELDYTKTLLDVLKAWQKEK